MNYFKRHGMAYGKGYGDYAMMPPAMAYPGGYGVGGMGAAPGIAVTPSMVDVSRFITDGLIRPITEGIRQATANFADTIGGMGGQGAMGLRGPYWGWQGRWQAPGVCGKCGGRGCEECWQPCERCDPCHCSCCVTDADLIIYSRLGERRVVEVECLATRVDRDPGAGRRQPPELLLQVPPDSAG